MYMYISNVASPVGSSEYYTIQTSHVVHDTVVHGHRTLVLSDTSRLELEVHSRRRSKYSTVYTSIRTESSKSTSDCTYNYGKQTIQVSVRVHMYMKLKHKVLQHRT